MALMVKQNGILYCVENKYLITGPCLIAHARASFVHGKGKRRCMKMKANMNTDMEKVNGKRVTGTLIPILEKRSNITLLGDDEYLVGRFVEKGLVFRQSFVIRSYEIGPDKTATMETLMNLLQETALNHVRSAGVAGNGFGATIEMSLRKLIWVVTRIHVQVDKYSSWGDVVEIDTWADAAGKNGMRRDWIIRDLNSRNIITRATSTWVMMNRETRRLSKIPDEVKKEVHPFYLNRAAIPTENADTDKIEKLTDDTAAMIQTGLAPRWSDMDANQHVNNVKYIGWLLESVPIKVLEDYNMTRMTLEYRRECRQSNVLQSLTSMKQKTEQGKLTSENNALKCTHLLRMEADQAEIVRARSVWKHCELLEMVPKLAPVVLFLYLLNSQVDA
ncbi:Palmitoyl-acyl carrier protein thioesterase-chloroplastic [Striga hermonthica]|uniref:Acyl-[acyl-carrier-protein] hydrolase n=1 Tax=Striga hermonthica TaxID=68872 RepID=A0A9N7NH63_STRHE|nr:Palmitoyl-acyl carrier protein thioesterase-chloroplastic [Striga hermonthica]